MDAKVFWRLMVLLVFPFSTPAMAALITEGVDYVDGANPNIGIVDVGITTVGGSINGECAGPGLPFICTFGAGPGTDPVDRFTFDIAMGAAVTSIEIDLITGLTAPAGFTTELDFDGGILSGLAPGLYIPLIVSPLTDPITLAISGDESTLSGSYTLDWTVTIEAIAVPAPAPLVLMALAGALIGVRRRG